MTYAAAVVKASMLCILLTGSVTLQLLSWLPRMLCTKISPPLSCFLELASYTCFFFRLLLSAASFYCFCFRDTSVLFWARSPTVFCSIRVSFYSFQGSPTGSPGSPGSPTGSPTGSPGSPTGSPGSPGTDLILELYRGTIIPEILHSLSIYLVVLTGLMWTTTLRTTNN